MNVRTHAVVGVTAAGAALTSVCGLATAGGTGDLCSGLDPVLIYSEIPGDPTAMAPGLGIEFTGLLTLATSPDGRWVIFKGFIDDPENDVVVRRDRFGPTAEVVARENQPTAIAGSVHSFLDSDCGINDSGHYAYGSRLEGVDSGTDEVIFVEIGKGQTPAAREGETAIVLTDPFGIGDETYGNSLNSTHVLADSRVAFRADQINNVSSDFESALYFGDVPQSQEGEFIDFDVGGAAQVDGFTALSGNTFSASPDGSVWIVEADIDPSFSSQDAVVVNNVIMLAAGDTIPGTSQPIDGVFAVDVDAQGNWYARGDFPDNTDWAVKNGVLVAMTGMPIAPGSSETWGDAISGLTGYGSTTIVTGNTSETDPDRDTVVVSAGSGVLAREGDTVFTSSMGDVEIASFSANDVAIAGGDLQAFVTLREVGTGDSLGDAYVEWVQVLGCNPADIAEPCGVVDLADINAFIAAFVGMDPIADLAEPSGVWDLSDLQAFISAFVNGCP